jgi:spore coat-associated protein N
MSRFKVLRANPRRTLAALATLLIAVGVTAASGANFSATSANPSNTFSSGTMSLLNNKEGAAVLTASNLKPAGPTQSGEVLLENTGSLPGAITLTKNSLVDSSPVMAALLDLTIEDCGADQDCTTGTGLNATTNVYTGTVAAMPAQNLGTWAAGAKHRYKFTVGLNGSALNNVQGKTVSVAYAWDAV